jgi:hypothetical protein
VPILHVTVIGGVPVGCGESSDTSPKPPGWSTSVGHQPSIGVVKTACNPAARIVSTRVLPASRLCALCERLTPHGIAATAARATGVLLGASIRDPSSQRPSRGYTAATAGLSHGRWSMQAPAMAGANCHAPARSGSRRGTMPVEAVSWLRPGTAC